MNELLTFIKNTASDARLFKYECKLAHLQAKSFVRGMYLQRAKDWLEEKIDYLGGVTDQDEATRLKYLAKLLEALAHLYCDPYLFDKAEVEMAKAERIYEEHGELLGRELHRKFLMKKSQLAKKSGFFVEALQILQDLQEEVETLLHKPGAKAAFNLKKELFKISRDKGRLHALRR